jgi:hypothetical protein
MTFSMTNYLTMLLFGCVITGLIRVVPGAGFTDQVTRMKRGTQFEFRLEAGCSDISHKFPAPPRTSRETLLYR